MYCDDDRARVAISEKIDKDNYAAGQFPQAAKTKMIRIEHVVNEHVNYCRAVKSLLLKRDVEDKVNEVLGKQKKGKAGNFMDDWNLMIEGMRSGDILIKKTKKRYSPGTIERYMDNAKRMSKYIEDKSMVARYEKVNEKWVNGLYVWANQQNYAKNTTALLMAQFRAFLTYTYDEGRHRNEIFKKSIMYFSREEVDAVALTEDEIARIYKLNLKGPKERARDIFVFGCYVGLRVEDLNRINNYKLVNDHFEFLTDKSDKKVKIPMHWMARKIYQKYNSKLPVYGCGGSLGHHLSDICKRAEINEPVLIVSTKGGVTSGNYYAKYELVSPHTMRRTLATNAVLAGIPDREVMLITGHSSVDSFSRYVKISDEMKLQLLKSRSWFKDPQQTEPSAHDGK